MAKLHVLSAGKRRLAGWIMLKEESDLCPHPVSLCNFLRLNTSAQALFSDAMYVTATCTLVYADRAVKNDANGYAVVKNLFTPASADAFF